MMSSNTVALRNIDLERPPRLAELEEVVCCICEESHYSMIGSGRDFEYNTVANFFPVVQCNNCGLVFLKQRPKEQDLELVYPPTYHAFDFSKDSFGIVHRVRRRIETRRLVGWCDDLPQEGRLIDVGCGDGFHIKLLQAANQKRLHIEGVDLDSRAVQKAQETGLTVHHGTLQELDLGENHYDMAIMVQTIEHVADPLEVLKAVCRLLKPGGKLVVVTDNTDTLDFRFFQNRHWGGYHFPRHWNLFNRRSLRLLAEKSGFEVEQIRTQVSPVNWVYSIHNCLVDKSFAKAISNRFTLRSPVALSIFTITDTVFHLFDKGALLHAVLRKPFARRETFAIK